MEGLNLKVQPKVWLTKLGKWRGRQTCSLVLKIKTSALARPQTPNSLNIIERKTSLTAAKHQSRRKKKLNKETKTTSTIKNIINRIAVKYYSMDSRNPSLTKSFRSLSLWQLKNRIRQWINLIQTFSALKQNQIALELAGASSMRLQTSSKYKKKSVKPAVKL